eukprot:2190126-Amphidinium_carterae.2
MHFIEDLGPLWHTGSQCLHDQVECSQVSSRKLFGRHLQQSRLDPPPVTRGGPPQFVLAGLQGGLSIFSSFCRRRSMPIWSACNQIISWGLAPLLARRTGSPATRLLCCWCICRVHLGLSAPQVRPYSIA